MNKGFSLLGAGIIAIYVFFQVFGALGGNIPGVEQSAIASGPQIRGCMRELTKNGADEAQAAAVCNCTFSEFEERGLSLMDALSEEHFAAMSEITRDCAQVHGVDLPNQGEGAVLTDDWG